MSSPKSKWPKRTGEGLIHCTMCCIHYTDFCIKECSGNVRGVEVDEDDTIKSQII